MNSVILSLLIGAGAGVLDIISMLFQKVDKYSIMSSFTRWLAIGFLITFTSIPNVNGWLKGIIIGLMITIPLIMVIVKDYPRSIFIVTIKTIILGALIGWVCSLIK